ncbi:MAG: hypothetical protein FJY29_11640 [Betaproteobacteria bacterium]|nr:hypothetical protein [Betaproteobacteria bacterium]
MEVECGINIFNGDALCCFHGFAVVFHHVNNYTLADERWDSLDSQRSGFPLLYELDSFFQGVFVHVIGSTNLVFRPLTWMACTLQLMQGAICLHR